MPGNKWKHASELAGTVEMPKDYKYIFSRTLGLMNVSIFMASGKN